MPAGPATNPEIETFSLEDFHGELAAAWRPTDLESALARLTDPAQAQETLHWGRNYLYSLILDTAGGAVEVVVKQFRNQGIAARVKRELRGSKAMRSWRGALTVAAAGVPTPTPVMVIESRRPDGPSYFVSSRLQGVFEARYLFRAIEQDRAEELYPGLAVTSFLEVVASTLRRLHDAGIWHRDVSVGNVLVRPRAGEPPEVFLLDLNRVRLGYRMSVSRRMGDLSRLRIFRQRHQQVFLDSYWKREGGAPRLARWLYLVRHEAFLLKIGLKKTVRHPLQMLAGLFVPRRPHVHIPPAPEQASPRDRIVWDRLSDQPHQHAGRLQRLRVRVADARRHGPEARALLGALPRVRRRYHELRADLYRRPLAWPGVGVAVRPWSEKPEALLDALDELGAGQVLLRLHPWEDDHRAEEELARELHARGYELVFALPQNRELVRDPIRWTAALEEIAGRFRAYGRHFQVGQAVNRSKWGVWSHDEYLDLVAAASAVLRDSAEVRILGPAVIDWELHRAAGILNVAREGVYFDIVSSLLYVDRRGAPENRQLGFDTVDKVVQLKAIAETARSSGSRCWITEFNWPLWEGPHSPAGRKVAVDEETQADFLARYYLLVLGSGMAERVYWWQLTARGYGLCAPQPGGELSRRAAFRALRQLAHSLQGSTFLGPMPTQGDARLYRFRDAEGRDLVVAWSPSGPTKVSLLRPPAAVIGRDGGELPVPTGQEVEIDGSPRYLVLV